AWVGKPMIIVPLPGSAQNHQLFNAAEAAKYGNIIIEGVNLTPNILISQLEKMLVPETLAEVGAKVRGFAHPDAADKIATTILSG
ncbi:MAG TPA: glycosyltransferase, partial [Candidatus Paceibacterota bacterium]|nr:glycosyltransferase [Candidatus Paceibacterota bacterium]